jgi:hypothetical protein
MAERLSNLRNIKPELLVLPTVEKLEPVGDLNHPPRILMLYGSLRERSFSRFLTYEAARILEHFGAEVKIFDPMELPIVGSVNDHFDFAWAKTSWWSATGARFRPLRTGMLANAKSELIESAVVNFTAPPH